MGRRVCIIANAGAGRKLDEAADARLHEALDRHEGVFDFRRLGPDEDLGTAAAAAAREGFDVVAAAGGDGTINAVASALADPEAPEGVKLGVLPLGTFNYVARGLGLPLELDAAADLLAEGAARPLDVGDVNGRLFLNNASLGAYPAILETRETIYQRLGRSRAAAHLSVLRTLAEFRSPLDARVAVDGTPRRRRTPLVFVAANAFQLERFGLEEGAEHVRAGEFAVFMPPDLSRPQLVSFAVRLGLGLLEPGRDFELFHGREIVIETRRPVRQVARDGERERMRSPFTFRLRRNALQVIAPEAGS